MRSASCSATVEVRPGGAEPSVTPTPTGVSTPDGDGGDGCQLDGGRVLDRVRSALLFALGYDSG